LKIENLLGSVADINNTAIRSMLKKCFFINYIFCTVLFPR
jgi:hypothetical protein